MFKSKLPTLLGATALVVAVFGSTPLGHAAAGMVLPQRSVGAAQLKTSAVVSKKIANNAVTGAKVKNGTLLAADFRAGQLPAGPQGPKGDPGPSTGPAGGDLQGSYPNPTIAPGAVTASKLVAEEPWRNVGAAGQPAFGYGWSSHGYGYQGIGFRKDRDGVVHLRGVASRAANSSGSSMFDLPAGYRPSSTEVFAVPSADGSGNVPLGAVEIGKTGSVVVFSATDDRFVSLSGISFTATQ